MKLGILNEGIWIITLEVVYTRPIGNTQRVEFPSEKNKGNDVEVAVYVPSTRHYDINLRVGRTDEPFQRRIKMTQLFLSRLFEGSTRVDGVGSYEDEKKGLITERVARVSCFTTRDKYARWDLTLKKWLTERRRNWGQRSIGYEYGGKMFFIR